MENAKLQIKIQKYGSHPKKLIQNKKLDLYMAIPI